jgi:hypothetical protein
VCEVNHPPPSGAEVKNRWSCTPTAPYMPSWGGQGQLCLGLERVFEYTVKVLSFKPYYLFLWVPFRCVVKTNYILLNRLTQHK